MTKISFIGDLSWRFFSLEEGGEWIREDINFIENQLK